MLDELDIQIEVSLDVPDIQIGFEDTAPDIVLAASPGGTNQPPYEGDYEVTSALFEETTLPTMGKAMRSNVTVHPIPIYEVSNPQGGITVTIGN